ncbi:Manganese transporter smf1 [Malassezia brasiliensis]|uniref:Manganese transporter smf1 n=1 Tax=Malassezia brasiliensis TaxID=1821822 RepID=A0AAF0INX7_9BASI|nr:Manganese transporter smf1 [Malassezia brasiliensis]
MSFVGPGLIAAVAYCDPGNWATDMEAGSRFGYITGMDLAVQTRRLVLQLPPDSDVPPDWNAPWMRARYWGLLIPLYIINEGAIIATELAELIGSAIALNLLFPSLPLWGGVLVTSADVFLVLFLYRPSMSVRIFESLIGALVLIVLACFIILLVRVKPDWGDVFKGYVPSEKVVDADGLYVSISILGATIMPHSLVLGSHFATIDRLEGYEEVGSSASSETGEEYNQEETDHNNPETRSSVTRTVSRTSSRSRSRPRPMTFWRTCRKLYRNIKAKHLKVPEVVQDDKLPPQQPASLEHIELSLKHASWDIAICLVLFAITINSAILIVASAAFYYGNNNTGDTEVVGDLFQAFELLRDTVGKVPSILFAIALLTAGQSSSITVTLAGQIISEGFIHWRLTPFMRRLLTRAIAVIPSMIVAALAGRSGLDEMLVASQVALSMALPFVSLPLLLLTGSRKRMRRELIREEPMQPQSSVANYGSMTPILNETEPRPEAPETSALSFGARMRRAYAALFRSPNNDHEASGPTYFHAFSNSIAVNALSYAVFLLICIADVYVLVSTLKDPSNA